MGATLAFRHRTESRSHLLHCCHFIWPFKRAAEWWNREKNWFMKWRHFGVSSWCHHLLQ